MKCPICGKQGTNSWSGMVSKDTGTVVDGCMCCTFECTRKFSLPWFVRNNVGNIYRWDIRTSLWKLYSPAIKDSKKIGGYKVIQT